MRLIDAEALKKQFEDRTLEDFTCYHFIEAIDNAPTVEITEEQAINKLHDTGWLLRHDKEMTERERR